MSTLSHEDGAAAAAAVMTPKATAGRAPGAASIKEDERRRKLLEWQESKASEKKAVAPERKAVPDRKAQFFERRERRLEEERKKRISRSGKENTGTPTATAANPRSMVTPSAVASRLVSTPRPGQGRDGQGKLVGTTPVSAARGPPPRARQAATTASAGARGTSGAETAGTPSRSSALLRPKASPYKEKSLQNSSKTAAAFGVDQPPARSSTTAAGDRLSGQLARLGAAGAGCRREGRVGVGSGAGGVALGAAARRETFQGSGPRAFSATDSGAAGVVRARPILRRVSSAMLSSERVVVSSGEVDNRRVASSAAAQPEDQHQAPSTPAATAAAPTKTPTGASGTSAAVQPLRVSSRSPNAPSTANGMPEPHAMLSDDSSSTTAAPAPIPVAVPKTATTVVRETATVLAEETNAASGAVGRRPLRVGFAEGDESVASKAVLVPEIVQEPISVRTVVPGGVSEQATAAAAAATVTAVDEKDVGEVRLCQVPSPSPRPSSDEKPKSSEGGEEGVGQGAGLIAREGKPDTKVAEVRQKLAVCEGVVEGAAAIPTETAPVPVQLERTRGAPLPAAAALTAAAEAPFAGPTAAAAVSKKGAQESAEEASAPAETRSSAEVAALLDGGGSVMEQKLTLCSRFSSVLSRGQQQPAGASTTMDTTGASGEGSAFSLAAEAKSIPDERSPSALDLENTGKIAPTGGAKPAREADDDPAASPSAAETKRREECPAARQSPDEAKGLVAQTGKGAREASPTSPAAAPFSGSTLPGNHSKLSSPPAGRTPSPGEEGRVGSATPAAEQAIAGPHRPRPALTPPGYRSRPCPPPADRTDARREEGPVERTSTRPKEVTTPSPPPGSRSTGLTPPGYLSRLSPPSAGKLVSTRGYGGKESEARSPAGARPSGLTPPGYRSRLSPLSAGGVGSSSREARVEDPASRSLSSVGGSGVVSLTPDRLHAGVRQAGGLDGTPPRCDFSPSCVFSSPARQEPVQEKPQQAVGAAEDEREKIAAREKDGGCSSTGHGGGGSPKGGVGQQCSSPCIANGRASTQPLLSGVVASPGTSSPARQQQQQQLQQRQQRAVQQDRGEEVQTKDAACSPITLGGGSREDGVAADCSTPRLGTYRIVSIPPSARSAVDRSSGVGVGGPDAADAGALLSGGRVAAPASPPPPPPKDEDGKGQEHGSPREFHLSPNFAAGFVVGRRKRRAVSGVPVVTAAAAEAEAVTGSSVGGNGDGGRRVSSRLARSRLERAKQSREEREDDLGAEEELGGDEESSSGESGSSWETCSSSEEEDGEEKWGGVSYLDEINEHPYTGGIVIDPDLIRSGSSSNGGGSTRSSLLRSSFGEARSGGRPSWGLKPPLSVATAEMGTQTGDGEGVKHALIQAGDGKLLSEAELQDECDLRELKERLEMMNHDRLSEVFHREIVKQEEAQTRKKLSAKHDAEVLELREEMEALKMAHNNEKIRIRWEHADELARVETEAGDGAGLMEELQEERRLRKQEEEYLVAAQQKERHQRREWEARCDDLVRDKREQAKRYAELRSKAAAEKKKLEKRLKKAEELVKEQLQVVKEIDGENDELREENDELREESDELREENARLRGKLGMEVEGDGEEEEEEG